MTHFATFILEKRCIVIDVLGVIKGLEFSLLDAVFADERQRKNYLVSLLYFRVKFILLAAFTVKAVNLGEVLSSVN